MPLLNTMLQQQTASHPLSIQSFESEMLQRNANMVTILMTDNLKTSENKKNVK